MPFCFSPWTNIDIDPQGHISPCCKFLHDDPHKQQNIITSDLASYTNSELIKEIKNDFLQGKWPTGCERCRIEEENAIESKRQLDYMRWKEYYDEHDIEKVGYLTASIAFGNTCNLKCITCGPDSSSRWYKEYEIIYSDSVKPNHFYKENFIEDVIASCPNLIHLDIPGGEPFLSAVTEQKKILDYYIQTGQAKNITLHYTTNLTIYPDKEWWERWKFFKEVDVQLSIDGIGHRYEYIRHPANWKVCEQNVDRYLEDYSIVDNLKLSISHTLSAFNIFYLDEFFSWCKTKKLPRPWVGRVHTPAHFRIGVYPESIKHHIIDFLQTSDFDDVKSWARALENQNDSEWFETFKTRTKDHDQYRGNSFSDSFAELAKLIEDNE